MGYDPEWHQKNKKRLYAEKVARRQRNRAIIAAARFAGVCSRCPETDAVCLDFHHIDPSTKSFSLGSMQAVDASEKRLRAELAKCILLCANCHRKHHLAPVAEVC